MAAVSNNEEGGSFSAIPPRFEAAVKKHRCPTCFKTFFDASNLRRHTVVHSGERPHICPVCHAGFSQSSSLKVHFRLHTGERPYRCHLCDYGASIPRGLRTHLYRMHGIVNCSV